LIDARSNIAEQFKDLICDLHRRFRSSVQPVVTVAYSEAFSPEFARNSPAESHSRFSSWEKSGCIAPGVARLNACELTAHGFNANLRLAWIDDPLPSGAMPLLSGGSSLSRRGGWG
jgi:hypothetical protein